MKTNILKSIWQPIIIAILVFLLIQNSCSRNAKIKTVIVPEAKGNFEAAKPTNVPIIDKPNSDKSKTTTKSNDAFYQKQIDALLTENEALINAYKNAPDTVKITKYEKAIQLNNFFKIFDDSLVNVKVNGTARGTIESLAIDYTIKERTIFVPIKKKIGVYLGAEIGSNFDLNQFTYKANLGIQNKKGTIYKASFQQIGSQKFGLVGMDFKIF